MLSDKIRRTQQRLTEGLILDGGLATELERLGFDLDHPLWSARVLLEEPEAIQAVHLDYLAAGAQCITTASYQASIPGLEEAGLSRRQTKDLLRQSVRLAQECRDYLLDQDESDDPEERASPLVAASCGPFGAYLADGSEFRGDYDVSETALYDFHAPRVEILADALPDLIAFETIPQAREARAIARLMKLSAIPAWVSFCCQDADRLASGESLAEAIAPLVEIESIVAVGVNCVSPMVTLSVIERIRQSWPRAIVAYPHAGGSWNNQRRCWEGDEDPKSFVSQANNWRAMGASVIGGCCRTTPEHIKRLVRVQKRTS
ncbi:homocysteine S-methyltransferase [bacterium]|nr:homocysteine S-methyltransferase [bacterium]